jgi:uncharacterized protein DUF4314
MDKNRFYYKEGEHPLIGKRIQLVSTNDPYTQLKSGEMGTVTDVNYFDWGGKVEVQIGVNWDSGSKMMLLEGKDSYKVFRS